MPLRRSAKILPEIPAFARRVPVAQPSIVNKPDRSAKLCWDRSKCPGAGQRLRGAAFGGLVRRAEHHSISDIVVRKYLARKPLLHRHLTFEPPTSMTRICGRAVYREEFMA